jgi:hypothetical protein
MLMQEWCLHAHTHLIVTPHHEVLVFIPINVHRNNGPWVREARGCYVRKLAKVETPIVWKIANSSAAQLCAWGRARCRDYGRDRGVG